MSHTVFFDIFRNSIRISVVAAECVIRKLISIAAALMLSACSTNYGMYKKGDEEHGQYSYVSTYLAIAVAAIIVSSAGGGGLYGDDDDDDHHDNDNRNDNYDDDNNPNSDS